MATNIHTYLYLYAGRAVTIRGRDGVFEVTKTPPRNGVNVMLRDENGRAYRCGITALEETDQPFMLKVDDVLTHLFLGTKVRVKGTKFPGTYVVIDKKESAIKVALLGGDGDRFVRCNAANLELVED